MASSSWQRRNERARELGFRNYYEQRNARAQAQGFSSYYERRITAGGTRPRPSGRELAVARGHAGKQDLLDWARPGGSTVSRIVRRDSEGRRTRIEVQYADSRGTRSFFLTGDLSDGALSDLHAELEAQDIDIDDYEPVWGPA